MRNHKKKIIFLSILLLIITLIIVRINIPCKLHHLHIFYGVLNAIDDIDVTDSKSLFSIFLCADVRA